MLYLSQDDIEIIGESVRRDYAKHDYSRLACPFDIENFARKHLGLAIGHMNLSDNGRILGLTTYKDVRLELEFKEGNRTVTVPEDTILIDDRLRQFENQRRERFTLSHECAHQIIARILEQHTGSSFRKEMSMRQAYSCRELKTAEDWCEWQANSLGAVLLMPKRSVAEDMNRGFTPFRPTFFGDKMNTRDYQRIRAMSDKYGVSLSAMTVRLKELGFARRRPESEYYDPLDIVVE